MDATSAVTRTPSEIARDVFHRIFEKRDLSDPYHYWSDDSVDHILAAGRTLRGPEELAQWFRDLFAAIPDWTLEVDRTVDDGERQVVVQWHATGTHTGGPFLGIEATGRRVEIRGIDVVELDGDGKFETNTVYYDGADFARQIGMLPPRDSALDRGMLAAFNVATKLKRRLAGR